MAVSRRVNKVEVPPVLHRKTGCNFCSHVRKKIKDGVAHVKKLISEDV